jgi:hypothetical protein
MESDTRPGSSTGDDTTGLGAVDIGGAPTKVRRRLLPVLAKVGRDPYGRALEVEDNYK